MQNSSQFQEENPQEDPQFPRPQWHKKLYWGALGIGTLLVGIVYGIWFDDFSETEMVELSFLWAGLLAFSVGGLQTQDRGPGKSLLVAVVAAVLTLVGLFLFFATVWSSL